MVSWLTAILLSITPGWQSLETPGELPLSPEAVPIPVLSEPAQKWNEVESILKEGANYEQEHRWGKAQDCYEKAIRRFPENVELQKRFNRSKMLNDIHRRFLDEDYVARVGGMSRENQEIFLRRTLEKYEMYYVLPISPNDIYRRAIFGLNLALSDVTFREKVVPNIPFRQIQGFQRSLQNRERSLPLSSREELMEAILAVTKECETTFQTKSSFFLMECVSGFVLSLDPYSTLLTPTQYREILATLAGNFVGLGVELQYQDGRIIIARSITGSPAEEAGILDGDAILEIAGKSTRGCSMDQVSHWLQGKGGTCVEMVVQTAENPPRKVEVERRRVVVPCVEKGKILPHTDGTAYVQILGFQNNTAKELDRVLWELYREGMKKLILDLRGNPGGLMQSAVETADLFVAEGVIVSTKGNQYREKSHTFYAKKNGTWRVPLVVLIDEKTASASEIFAGAIRDHGRGKIIGSRSYGKGTVQGIFELGCEDFGIKLTTSLFYSPKGRKYHHAGVQPDLEVREMAKPPLSELPQEATVQPAVGHSALSREKDAVLTTAIEVFAK
ncbi:MAG: S41 family peptidase [Planctomycetia bacterium]|nr:S41 family peptidase [Planctomycetia bacterium]